VGTSDSSLIFSLRTKRAKLNAGQMARRMVKGLGTAGGHNRTGGGQIRIQDIPPEKADKMRQSIQKRFLKYAGQENAPEERLLPDFSLRNGVT
jgi:nanoRNase/pAp phosphatase (c-di-AMP/oligoRNAs hydrolase)